MIPPLQMDSGGPGRRATTRGGDTSAPSGAVAGGSRAPEAVSGGSRVRRLRPRAEREAALRRADRLAGLLDTRWSVGGIRFGLDSVIGLIPGVGDWATAMIGLAILRDAHRAGAPRDLLARMAANLAIDGLVGTIPVVGDAFDVVFKAHRRNADLLRRWAELQD